MKLTVKLFGDKKIHLDNVKPEFKIREIKGRIQELEKFSIGQQKLLFNDDELKNNKKLTDYAIQDGSVLQLVLMVAEKIKIKIINEKNKVIKLDVRSIDTVEELKLKIKEHEKINVEKQQIRFINEYLEDEMTLIDYEIKDGSALDLIYRSTDSFQIFAKLMNGSTITLEIESTDTIKQIQEKIEEKAGVPPEQQRLVYSGKVLDKNKLVSDYKIKKHDTIVFLIALKGGSGNNINWSFTNSNQNTNDLIPSTSGYNNLDSLHELGSDMNNNQAVNDKSANIKPIRCHNGDSDCEDIYQEYRNESKRRRLNPSNSR